MKSQACEPCAKRKVRCDRVEPLCSNCKRRKKDHCVYPDESPFERIKRLEETIRDLKRDPSSAPAEATPPPQRSNTTNPVIIQEGDRSIYLESKGWQKWIDSTRVPGSVRVDESSVHNCVHSTGTQLPHAFGGSLWRYQSQSIDSSDCPIRPQEAARLWDTFIERVEPLIKITFEWTLEELRFTLTDPARWKRASLGDQTFNLSACYFGAVSLSKEESVQEFGRPKSSLLIETRSYCEETFTRMNMLAVSDMSTLRALCLYMKASIDLVSTQSLWSLMGLASRNAEQLGLHRDGQLLGLSPLETEERSRLWWQLQHLDLILSIKSGATPLTFTADWDSKLPLNIEDRDLGDSAPNKPEERVGLTSLSYTLFTYWMISQQRAFRQKRLNQPSPVSRSLLSPLMDTMVDELETGLNKTFLQYCDPIKPLDTLLQISARAVVCVLRLRGMHEMRLHAKEIDDKSREDYFDACLQSLRYIIAAFSQPSLERFYWYAESAFTWHAFLGVLVDAPHLRDIGRVKAGWALLNELYSVCPNLTDFTEDRRRLYAARSVVVTWSVCQQKPSLASMDKPAFVSELEACLAKLDDDDAETAGEACRTGRGEGAAEPDAWQNQPDISDPFNFNFADIDWSFWDGLS